MKRECEEGQRAGLRCLEEEHSRPRGRSVRRPRGRRRPGRRAETAERRGAGGHRATVSTSACPPNGRGALGILHTGGHHVTSPEKSSAGQTSGRRGRNRTPVRSRLQQPRREANRGRRLPVCFKGEGTGSAEKPGVLGYPQRERPKRNRGARLEERRQKAASRGCREAVEGAGGAPCGHGEVLSDTCVNLETRLCSSAAGVTAGNLSQHRVYLKPGDETPSLRERPSA